MIITSGNVAMSSSRKSNSVYIKETEGSNYQKGSKVKTLSHTTDILTISEEAQEYLANSRYKHKSRDFDMDVEKSMEFVSEEEMDNTEEAEKADSEESKKNKKNEPTKTSLITGISASSKGALFEIEDERTIKLKAALRILQAITGNIKGLKALEDTLFGKKMEFEKKFKNFSLKNADAVSDDSNNNSFEGNSIVWKYDKKESSFIKEEEVTSFSSVGHVKTADGRDISFNVNVEMSRSFEQYVEKYTSKQVILQDPLVINLDSAPANISDQTFFFDIDADGKKEEVSQLGKGSGFLALDKNDDGVINDGSELFGALSGNGFEELAKYDDDGNGWIDEADTIFDKLRVWTKDEKGNDVLLSLKEADLGAIYLNNVSTEFSVNDSETNQQKAQVRSTGVYLKESGGAGSIQQVDLAVKR